MVAIVNLNNSIRHTLNYNENKVKEGVAECIGAVNYPKDLRELTFNDKINRLLNQAALRPTVKENCMHISLNFPPQELLENEKMFQIAEDYMQRMGMGGQPFLLYRHNDAGHPHLHIVTVPIRQNGARIRTHNIGRNQSRQACIGIEKDYGLIPAQKAGEAFIPYIPAVSAEVVKYGKKETKRSIANVLGKVVDQYRYSSLEELNAVLKLYNVRADCGSPDSRTFRHGGLVYQALDNGLPIGKPVKASLFFGNPGLEYLKGRFRDNAVLKQKDKNDLRSRIRLALNAAGAPTLSGLIEHLRRRSIALVVHAGKNDQVYGLTFVDHKNKTVFKGSDLGMGKEFSAASILQKCGIIPPGRQDLTVVPVTSPAISGNDLPLTDSPSPQHKTVPLTSAFPAPPLALQEYPSGISVPGILDILMRSELTPVLPYALRQKKNKKKRRKRI